MTDKGDGGNHPAGERSVGGCQRLAGESGRGSDDRPAGENGRGHHRGLRQQPWPSRVVAGMIDPCELPRAASEIGNRFRYASDGIQQLTDKHQGSDDVIVECKPSVVQTIRAMTPSDDAREANDLRRSEIQSTSYLVVDTVRSTMTGFICHAGVLCPRLADHR